MSRFPDTIHSFELKLVQLVESHKQIKAQLEELRAQNATLTSEIERQKNIIKDLEENNKLVKIAGTISQNEEEQKVLKRTLEGYISEINRCIALLNASD